MDERGCPARFSDRSQAFRLIEPRSQSFVPDAAARPGFVLGGRNGDDHDVSRRLPDFRARPSSSCSVSYPLRPSSLFGTACYQTGSKISVGGAKYTGRRPLQAPERLLHQRLRLLQDFRIHLAAAARPAKNKSLRRAAGRGGIHDVITQRRAGSFCKKKRLPWARRWSDASSNVTSPSLSQRRRRERPMHI